MPLNNGFTDVQTQPGALNLGGGGVAGTVETLEEMGKFGLGNADACINHFELPAALYLARIDANLPPLRGKFKGIADEVDDNLFQAVLVADQALFN
jgi:hypothetical protein